MKNIAIWSPLGRIGPYVTGVGKHIIYTSLGLAKRKELSVELLLPKPRRSDHRNNAESPMNELPGVGIPFTRRFLESSWLLFNSPKIDRWAGDVDWVYCPQECYVPVRNVRLALAVHDVYSLEYGPQDAPRLRRAKWRHTVQRALNQASVVITVSEFTKGRMLDLLDVSEKKIFVIGDGAEEGFYEIAKLSPEDVSPYPETKYLICIGGLTRKKGAENVLRFASVLARERPEMLLVMVGVVDGKYRGAANAASNIRVLSRGLANEEIQKLVRGAVGLVSLSEYEGFGIPVIEAMAAGVPTIVADRSALPETAGEAGVVVDPDNPGDVVRAVEKLVEDGTYREDIIRKGRERAESFTWDRCVDRLVSALQAVE